MILTRIAKRLVLSADRAISRIYNARHPGAAERQLLSALTPLTGACQPNDKWNLHILAPRWAEGVECPAATPLPRPKSIFIFCVFRGVFTTHLVLAVLLAWRGHKVTIGYLPKVQGPGKPPLVEHSSARPYLRSIMSRIGGLTKGAITCVDLYDDLAPAPVDQEFVARQARYDTIMTRQMETLDFEDPEMKRFHGMMAASGEKTQIAVRNHLRTHRYDLCIIGNGTTFDGAHACHVIKNMGLQVNCTEKFAFRGVRVINHGDHFLAGDDLNYIWEQRERLGYTREPHMSKFLDKARQSILERSQNSTTTWLWELQHAVNQSERDALRAANVPEDQPFILICPNVVFDAGYGKITNVFPTMTDWLVETVRFLNERTDRLVVVRAHPGEGLYWGGKEPVHEVLARHGIKPSEKLVIIPGQARVNTYRLMERCQFGVVFSSSTGLEMAVMGKQVVTASDIFYANRGFTLDAPDKAGYFRQLGEIADKTVIPELDPASRDRALLFYFVYHWVMQYPYPYDKPSWIARRPPAKLLRSVDMTPFLPYLDLIAMDTAEFREQVHRYLGAEQILRRIETFDWRAYA